MEARSGVLVCADGEFSDLGGVPRALCLRHRGRYAPSAQVPVLFTLKPAITVWEGDGMLCSDLAASTNRFQGPPMSV